MRSSLPALRPAAGSRRRESLARRPARRRLASGCSITGGSCCCWRLPASSGQPPGLRRTRRPTGLLSCGKPAACLHRRERRDPELGCCAAALDNPSQGWQQGGGSREGPRWARDVNLLQEPQHTTGGAARAAAHYHRHRHRSLLFPALRLWGLGFGCVCRQARQGFAATHTTPAAAAASAIPAFSPCLPSTQVHPARMYASWHRASGHAHARTTVRPPGRDVPSILPYQRRPCCGSGRRWPPAGREGGHQRPPAVLPGLQP